MFEPGEKIVGWHYTSANLYFHAIQYQGLVPQVVSQDKQDSIEDLAPSDWDRKGTWVWQYRPTGASHAGCILFQVGTKGEPHVVLLEVTYTTEDILSADCGSYIRLIHKGHVGKWQYHDRDKAYMLKRPIAPTAIRLLQVFDVVDMLGVGLNF